MWLQFFSLSTRQFCFFCNASFLPFLSAVFHLVSFFGSSHCDAWKKTEHLEVEQLLQTITGYTSIFYQPPSCWLMSYYICLLYHSPSVTLKHWLRASQTYCVVLLCVLSVQLVHVHRIKMIEELKIWRNWFGRCVCVKCSEVIFQLMCSDELCFWFTAGQK